MADTGDGVALRHRHDHNPAAGGGVRNPTVRLRYLAAREVLTAFPYTDLYDELLTMLGCRDMTPRACRSTSMRSAPHSTRRTQSPETLPVRSDISAAARPISIDGSREPIRAGNHREAVFWIVATFARCHTILAVDAPQLQRAHAAAFDAVVADLGIQSSDDLRRRGEAVINGLPRLWEAAEAIMAANPAISPR